MNKKNLWAMCFLFLFATVVLVITIVFLVEGSDVALWRKIGGSFVAAIMYYGISAIGIYAIWRNE